jgi:hypothetical protein
MPWMNALNEVSLTGFPNTPSPTWATCSTRWRSPDACEQTASTPTRYTSARSRPTYRAGALATTTDCREKEPSEIATPQRAAELWNRSVAWVGLPA